LSQLRMYRLLCGEMDRAHSLIRYSAKAVFHCPHYQDLIY
jgi:hypothetical protein